MSLVIESANDYAIFATDTERRVTSWSLGAEMMMGYTEAEITGKPADIIFTPEDREKHDHEKEVEIAEKKDEQKMNAGIYVRTEPVSGDQAQ